MKKFLLAVGTTVLFSVPAMACDEPGARPEIPDPSTAVTAQMVKTNNEVKAYVQAQQDFISCSSMSSSQKRKAINDLKAYADSFNQAVRQFKLASN